MNLITITEISKKLSLSTRTLRYYEQIGLIKSVRTDDYAYRTYDEEAVTRLQQILLLRKLRIPLKQISVILQSQNTKVIIDTFRQNLAEVDDEITALSTIRDIINTFITRLKESIHEDINLNLLDDTALLEAVDALTVRRNPIRDTREPLIEEKTAEDLQAASEMLLKLTDRDVRIVYLPPMTVASIHIVGQDANGEHAEYTSAMILDDFIKKVNLQAVYPAARSFGFNNPDGIDDNDPAHGFERWISIPDDMEVLPPLIKKRFEGGMYAAHVIPMGAWDEGWMPLYNWVAENNDRYVGRWGMIDGTYDVCGWIEEHLNYWDWNNSYDGKSANQVDLLMPIKPRFAAGTRHPQERIIETFNYNGIPIEIVEWDATIWGGKIGYQGETTNDPNVDWVQPILDGFFAIDISTAKKRIEPDWDVCININHLSPERPNGVMCGFLVGTENQPEGFNVYKVPAGRYLRLAINDDSAKALGSEPWKGGMPPFEWVGEQLAPQFGYHYGDDHLPIFEYYGYYKPEKKTHEFCYLYVPVEKIK